MGKENLIQNKKSLTPEERRERASKAGVASGESRRKRKKMRDVLSDLMEANVTEPEIIDVLEKHGLPFTQEAAICFAAVKKAQRGDIEACRFIRDTLGEKPRDDIAIEAETFNSGIELDLKSYTDEQLLEMIARAQEEE